MKTGCWLRFGISIRLKLPNRFLPEFPDLDRYEEIKDYTFMEFVFRQLEMCDFIREE